MVVLAFSTLFTVFDSFASAGSPCFPFGFFSEEIQIRLVDEVFHLFQRLFPDGRLQLAFPYREHVPAHAEQFCLVPLVALLVCFDFVGPVFDAAVRDMAVSMPVPEAAMHKNHKPVFAQHDVRRSRQALDVFPVAVAAGKEIAAHDSFGPGVLAPDFGHHGRPLLFAPDVHGWFSSSWNAFLLLGRVGGFGFLSGRFLRFGQVRTNKGKDFCPGREMGFPRSIVSLKGCFFLNGGPKGLRCGLSGKGGCAGFPFFREKGKTIWKLGKRQGNQDDAGKKSISGQEILKRRGKGTEIFTYQYVFFWFFPFFEP